MATLHLSELDPEYKEIYNSPNHGAPVTPPGGLLEIREAYNAWAKAQAESQPIPAGITITDCLIPSSSPDVSIQIRTYVRTTETDETFPLIFIIHGGGFMVGNLDAEEINRRNIAAEIRASVITVEYRLAPENPFPTGLSDVYTALKWSYEHAQELRADPSKGFIVSGQSAGGNLAAVSALRARDDPEFTAKLTGQVLQIPMVCHSYAYPDKYKDELLSLEQNAQAPLLSKADMEVGSVTYQGPPASWEMSPLLASSHSGLPPTFIQVVGLDPLRDDGILYEKVLREAGVNTKIDSYPGVPHTFQELYPHLKASQKWKDDQMAGIKWLLEQGNRRVQ